MSEYKKLSPTDIQEKIDSGCFVKQEMVIRDKASGQIVKLEHLSKHETGNYPNSFFQVNNNYIYQFDTEELLKDIKKFIWTLALERYLMTIIQLLISYQCIKK
ncbi:hypothetical protein [Vibrio diabolicus]|uniref:hypothetical protein n=2 Tax=Vibrio harveyi group TaxID=717610 RepID=UPI0011B020CF|nr:hypothetical protein [Vibrio diabolicus]